MEHYKKIKSVHHAVVNPFTELFQNNPINVKEVKVTSRSVFSKVIGYSIRLLRQDDIDAILLIGQEDIADVVLKCANVLQGKFKGNLHQCNADREKEVEDIWMPDDKSQALDLFSVKTFIPVLFILLSKNDMHLKLGATIPKDNRKKANKNRKDDK